MPLINLKLYKLIDINQMEGTMSQIFYLALGYNFISKKREDFGVFLKLNFLHLIKQKLFPPYGSYLCVFQMVSF